MRPVTYYEANDGTVFPTPGAARAHEQLIVRCRFIANQLQPAPASNDRVRHRNLYDVMQQAAELCAELLPQEPLFKRDPAMIPWDMLSKVMPDRYHDVLWRELVHRLARVGDDGYEYPSVFYALNPAKWAEDREAHAHS